LLQRIAVLNGDPKLEAFLKTPRGRARIRAIHHLSHGNHRLYVVLSELITAESLDALVRPFEEMVDEQLTPYYQERLRWLSPLQRKIVELLCQRRQPIPVKDIADRLFASHSTITPQLKNLREMGYVVSTPRGRESLYELAEPLMRLSMQVKETPQAEPLGVIVDFLRVWYERDELEDRLARSDPSERIRDYLVAAVAKLQSGEPNLRHQLMRLELEGVDPKSCSDQQFEQLRVLAEETNASWDWLWYGRACRYRKDYDSALAALTIATRDAPVEVFALAVLNRAYVSEQLGRLDEATLDYTKLIDLPGNPLELNTDNNLILRGTCFAKMGRIAEAMNDYSQVIDNPGALPDTVAFALMMRAATYIQTDALDAAVGDFSRVIELPEARESDVAAAKRILASTCDAEVASVLGYIGSPEVCRARAHDVVKSFADQKALAYLGDSLVRHLPRLTTSPISGDGLKQWLAHWESAASAHESMRFPLRLLRVGVDYLTSQPKDPGKLLELPAEERSLLQQMLSLPT
jgi:tetratricopeptide (TPR) repeat protein/DNA-binding CsgD family transcriptional regulator